MDTNYVFLLHRVLVESLRPAWKAALRGDVSGKKSQDVVLPAGRGSGARGAYVKSGDAAYVKSGDAAYVKSGDKETLLPRESVTREKRKDHLRVNNPPSQPETVATLGAGPVIPSPSHSSKKTQIPASKGVGYHPDVSRWINEYMIRFSTKYGGYKPLVEKKDYTALNRTVRSGVSFQDMIEAMHYSMRWDRRRLTSIAGWIATRLPKVLDTVRLDRTIPYGEITGYVTAQNGTRYEDDDEHLRKQIRQLWMAGYRQEQFRDVVEAKARKWRNTKWEHLTSPYHLYSPDKFPIYYGETRTAVSKPE
jgi:uncharacterized phage protein (TIGR02220 family)